MASHLDCRAPLPAIRARDLAPAVQDIADIAAAKKRSSFVASEQYRDYARVWGPRPPNVLHQQ